MDKGDRGDKRDIRDKGAFSQRVYQIVSMIPEGKVATYGEIALLIGVPRAAQAVGWVMHLMDGKLARQSLGVGGDYPWHRVINREGRISTKCLDHTASLQKKLLEEEGIEVTEKQGNGYIELSQYQWWPKENQIKKLELPQKIIYQMLGNLG